MKKRSENCWLMQSRMVAAVATTSAQRQPPRRLRTRVTSASCMLAWGSSNTIFFASAAATLSATVIWIPRCVALPLAQSFAKPIGHVRLGERIRARLQPAIDEGFFFRRWITLVVIRPGRGQHVLTLVESIVVGLLLGRPLAGFLQRLDRAGVHRHHPIL